MGEYGYIDEGLPGLLTGLDNQVEGTWAAKAPIEFGVPVFTYPGEEVALYPYIKDAAVSVYDADLVTGNLVDIVVNGDAVAQVPFNTDHDTTMDDIIVALVAVSGVDAILDVDDANNRTLIIRTVGATAVVTNVVTGGAGQAVATITTTTAQIYVGMSVRTDNSDGNYLTGVGVNVLVEGYCYALAENTIVANQSAFVGATGKLANAGVSIPGTYKKNAVADALTVINTRGYTSLGVADLF